MLGVCFCHQFYQIFGFMSNKFIPMVGNYCKYSTDTGNCDCIFKNSQYTRQIFFTLGSLMHRELQQFCFLI